MASERLDWLKKNVNENKKVIYGVTAAITTVSGLIYLGKYFQKRKLQQQLQDFEAKSIEENKVILHMSPTWDFSTPHPSPYVTKMIAFLSYNKVPYITDTTFPMHFRTQKMPWITYKNHHQPDSNLIMEWFTKQKDFDYINMDKHLNKKQLAISNAYKSMIEDGLGMIMGYRRWYDENNLKKYWPMIIGDNMSTLSSKLILSMYKGQIKKSFWLLGISRFKEEQVYKKGEVLIGSVIQLMGDNNFFFGDILSSLDICIYGIMGAMFQCCFIFTWGMNKTLPAKMPYMKEVNQYMKRIEIECFGEVKYWKDIV
eukprot:353120_1